MYCTERFRFLTKEKTRSVSEYSDVLERVARLPRQDKVELLAELATQVRDESREGGKRSIMELEGLGKEIWAGIDAQEYVNRERDSWDG